MNLVCEILEVLFGNAKSTFVIDDNPDACLSFTGDLF